MVLQFKIVCQANNITKVFLCEELKRVFTSELSKRLV